MLRARSWIAATALLSQACDGTFLVETTSPPAVVTSAVDSNPDPAIVEVDLRASEAVKSFDGRTNVNVWAYNDVVPGPVIEGRVGDKLIVNFKNDLPDPTTIHWHGLRLPATMDGTLVMQNPIEPGETFKYEYTLKDAGLFWYHPHIQGAKQVQKGLHGVLRVRGPNEPAVDREQILVLDDIRLEGNQVDHFTDDDAIMMGSEGDTWLVNGSADPVLSFPAGGLVRLRLVNVANGRFFNLRLSESKFTVIGTDGGFLPEPYEIRNVLLAPGERYDVLVQIAPDLAGATLSLINEPYERGHHSGDRDPRQLARVQVSEQPVAAPHAMPLTFPEVEKLPLMEESDFRIALDEGTDSNGDLEFTVNGRKYPDVPAIEIQRGEVRSFEIVNESEMDHPFHVHGVFFQVLERDGKPAELWANKDTVIVPAESRLRFSARFEEAGTWMYHCHILEHAEFGMMGTLEVK